MIALAGGSSQTIPRIFMISGQIERIKPLSLWERVAEGRCDPSQIQPLSLWERVASFRPKLNPSPSGRGWPKAG